VLTHGLTCVVADDHPPIVASVSRYLAERGVDVVAEARTGTDALAAIERHRPAVAVVDHHMPGLEGTEVVARAQQSAPETAIVLYLGAGDPSLAAEAVAAGARGVLLKEAPLTDVLRSLELVTAGRVYIDAALGGQLAGDGRPVITPRERQILLHLANGLKNDEIGRELFISAETVRTHIRRTLGKLGAPTRTAAIATAFRTGLIK
jgi:two-component system, NarL family, nitrate/nitrite response regulator NarL